MLLDFVLTMPQCTVVTGPSWHFRKIRPARPESGAGPALSQFSSFERISEKSWPKRRDLPDDMTMDSINGICDDVMCNDIYIYVCVCVYVYVYVCVSSYR